MTDRERPAPQHRVPDGIDAATLAAVGKVTEALEAVEHARGHLYAFHRLTGTADLTLGEGVRALREAGHADLADELERELVGRNVLEGRWTFQVVEEYDEGYWSAFRTAEHRVRERLVGGRRHLHEAGMKEDERTRRRRHHEAVPPEQA